MFATACFTSSSDTNLVPLSCFFNCSKIVKFPDAYPPFLSNQLINMCDCIGDKCTMALARSRIIFITSTSFFPPFAPMRRCTQWNAMFAVHGSHTATNFVFGYTSAVKNFWLQNVVQHLGRPLCHATVFDPVHRSIEKLSYSQLRPCHLCK